MLRLVRLLIALIILSGFVHITFAATKKLTIEARVNQDFPIKKSLLKLAKELEELSKDYQTSDQTSYWESEGKKSFNKLLRSEGYYSGSINVEIPNDARDSLIFHINDWRRYLIKDVNIKYANDSNTNINLPDIEDLKFRTGQFAVARNIINAQNELTEYIENNNCLLSLEMSHEAIINHINNTVSILFIIDAGQTATIEDVTFTGLEKVKPEYARKLTKLQNGQCFRNSDIARSRMLLHKSGLFSTTKPIIPKATNKEGSVPVVFNLKERAPRSVSTGVLYSTDLGIGGKFGWEHRNAFGSGESIKTSLIGNKKEQTLSADYFQPFYRRDDQTLKLNFAMENQISKSFNSREESTGAIVERKFNDYWSVGLGGRLSYAKIKVKTDSKNKYHALFSTPLFISQDTRNNLLNPKKGHLIKAGIDPFFSLNKEESPFFKLQVSASRYFLISQRKKPILAVRAAMGSILGDKLAKIPHTERFFVGGHNSLRGYAPQFAGNLDAANRPTGGRSFLETSAELRVPVTSSIEMVGFLDSGYAYSRNAPELNQKLLHGAGFGIRYLTEFGPIRADIAFPIKKRKSIDDAYQIYLGIGQSF